MWFGKVDNNIEIFSKLVIIYGERGREVNLRVDYGLAVVKFVSYVS